MVYLFNLLRLKWSNYSWAIYIWITLAICFTVLVYAVMVSVNMQVTLKESNDEVNKQVFSQIEYNMEYTSELITNLCISTYTNPDVITMMYTDFRDDDYYTTIKTMDRIRNNLLNINKFIHSIYIYNAKTDTYYSTFNGINYQDDDLIAAIKRYQNGPPVRMPTARKILTERSGTEKEDVFTYSMYETIGKDGLPEGAVYINVYAKWILENLKRLNSDGDRENYVYLIDDKGEFFGINGENDFLTPAIRSVFDKKIREQINKGSKYASTTLKIENEKFLATYLYIKSANWTIIRIQSYQDIYRNIKKSNVAILIITGIMLFFGIFLSMTVSKKIYKPIGTIIQEWKKSIETEDLSKIGKSDRDDIVFLHNVMRKSAQTEKKLITEKYFNQQIFKTFYLRKLLLDSLAFSDQDRQKLLEGAQLAFDFNKPIRICFIRLDNYKLFQKTSNKNDMGTIKFAMMNIFVEVLSEAYFCETLDMKNDGLALIFNDENLNETIDKKLIALLRKSQGYVLEYLSIMTTIGLSPITMRIDEITSAYNSANQLSLYRFVYGRMAVIDPYKVMESHSKGQIDAILVVEKKLIDEIRYGNLNNVDEQLLLFLQYISHFPHDQMMLSIMQLLNAVRNALHDLQKTQLDSNMDKITNVLRSLLDFETIDDLYYELIGTLKSVLMINRIDGYEKHILLVETIDEFLLGNFTISSVCLSQIATTLKMSPNYIGRVYKDIKGVSIAEQLNEIRMLKAAELMDLSNIPIGQIVTDVGIENISHFYRNFKKRFGVTPKEYTLKRAIEKI